MTKRFQFGAISPDPLDFDALQQVAEDDPVGLLEQCRKRQRTIKKGKRRLGWELCVACYAGAVGIREHPDRFNDLLKHEFFEQRTYKAEIKDVLRLALLVGTDADTSGRTYQDACYIAGKLQPFFDQDVEPEVVLDAIIAKKGLKRLHEDGEILGEDENQANDDEEEVEDEDDEDDCPKANGIPDWLSDLCDLPDTEGAQGDQPSTRASRRSSSPAQAPIFNRKTDLALGAEKYLERIFQIDVGDEIWALIQRAPDDGEIKRYRTVRLKDPKAD